MEASQSVVVTLEEGTPVCIPLAGCATRTLAKMIDVMCQLILAGAFLAIPGTVAELSTDATQTSLLVLAALGTLASIWIYSVAFEILWDGQTPGKRIMSIAVVDSRGLPPTVASIVTRNLLMVIDMMPLLGLVGMLCVLIDEKERRVGDLFSGTYVVRHFK